MRAWLSLLLLSLFAATVARADVPLDVAPELRGVPLGRMVGVLEDPTGKLGIEQVLELDPARFRTLDQRDLNFGFTSSAYWVRISVVNSASVPRAFMLELAHPQLDYVTLYVPEPGSGGFEVRRTGDMLPFAQRDLAYRNFVFTLEQPANGRAVYYLRVATEGLVELPLVAWTVEEFVEHQHLDWAGLCVFYGMLVVLAAYSFVLWLFTHERASLEYAALAATTCLFQLSLVGHATQFFFPDSAWLAQVAVPISLGLLHLSGCLLGKRILLVAEGSRLSRRIIDGMVLNAALIVVLGMVAPVRTTLTFHMATMPLIAVLAVWMVLRESRRGEVPGRWAVLTSYLLMFGGAAVSNLRNAGVLPTTFVTTWSYQIGATLQLVMLGTVASHRLTLVRNELAQVTDQLAHKVEELEDALVRAERATRLTEWATRVKDEFMATMSHELRTPLNTIINIPQGLVEEFVVELQAACEHCTALFTLEPGERVGATSACLDCGRTGTLRVQERARHVGDGVRTVHYLEKIERSGMHLLGVVNGMLQADKGEVGRVVLQRAWIDVAALARDVVEDMSDLAERARVKLAFSTAGEQVECSADPLRLRQVLINLVGNAIKFSNGQGTVTVRVEHEAAACVFSVQDEGIGIAPDELETVFGSYQQAVEGRAYGGTGLGLSISRSLVRAHGGELHVRSELGRGSTFTFDLPRRRREQKSA